MEETFKAQNGMYFLFTVYSAVGIFTWITDFLWQMLEFNTVHIVLKMFYDFFFLKKKTKFFSKMHWIYFNFSSLNWGGGYVLNNAFKYLFLWYQFLILLNLAEV